MVLVEEEHRHTGMDTDIQLLQLQPILLTALALPVYAVSS
jgi:hypothetical protein